VIRFSAVLVAVAIGVLVGGIATSKLSLVYLAIVVSAAALVALGIGVVLKREELFGNRPGLVPAGAGASPAFPVGPAGQDRASQDRTGAPVPPGPVVPAAAEPGVAGVAAPTVPSPVIAAAASTDLFTPRPAPARPASWAPLPWDVPADGQPAPSAEATTPAPSEWFDWPGQPAGDPAPAAPPEVEDEEAPELGLPAAEPPTQAAPVLSEAAVTRATPAATVPVDGTVPAGEISSADEAAHAYEAADADPAEPAAAEVTAVASGEPAVEADDPASASADEDEDADLDADAAPASAAGLVALIRGVPRYHQPECVLIRFMSDEDIQKMPVSEARAAGCTPCSACQPAEA
jgi:hypothetical protein